MLVPLIARHHLLLRISLSYRLEEKNQQRGQGTKSLNRKYRRGSKSIKRRQDKGLHLTIWILCALKSSVCQNGKGKHRLWISSYEVTFRVHITNL